MIASYRYYISLTSQLPFCGIPFRLDSYSKCQFGCRYCFASARGGAFSSDKIAAASHASLRRKFERIRKNEPVTAIEEMLAARIPLHFGGMSDPFMPLERKHKSTLELLKVLADNKYPVVISTKGVVCTDSEYLEVLKKGRFAIQYSFSTQQDAIARRLEPGTPLPSERLAALKTLSRSGIPTAIRLQPFLPGAVSDAHTLLAAAAKIGVRHFALEHLKLPVEQDADRRARLNIATGMDLFEYYRTRGAARVGREWILPAAERVAAVSEIALAAHEHGLSFGAADSDLLHWSDGNVCCSAADLLGMGRGLRFNFLTAVRRGMRKGVIRFSSIANEWRPAGPISQYVNSNSRSLGGKTIDAYIRARWNGAANGPSPQNFYGVHQSERFDNEGFRIYRYDPEALPPFEKAESAVAGKQKSGSSLLPLA